MHTGYLVLWLPTIFICKHHFYACWKFTLQRHDRALEKGQLFHFFNLWLCRLNREISDQRLDHTLGQ